MPIKRKRALIFILISLIMTATIVTTLIVLSKYIPFNTLKLGQINTGGETQDVDVEGNMAYIVDTSENNLGGLFIIDVSNPRSPSLLGSFFDGGLSRKVDVVGNIAYLANTNLGLEVINVSNPSNPVKIDNYYGAVYDVQIIGDLAYLADWSRGLVILNVSDPYNVVEISNLNVAGSSPHLHVFNNTVCIVDHLSSYSSLRIINVSDPYHPVQLTNHAPSGIDYWNPFLENNYIYVCNHGLNGGEVYILDISNPIHIATIGSYDEASNIFAVYAQDNKLYLADYDLGLIILDISNPSSPIKIGHYFDGGHGTNLKIIGNIAYMADMDGGLEIIQILTI
ncbi:MAG: LVIVD repeat-containing protein [Candidatus Thorarchaeota archaeon]